MHYLIYVFRYCQHFNIHYSLSYFLTIDEMAQRLDKLFKTLRAKNLKINPSKCVFATKKPTFAECCYLTFLTFLTNSPGRQSLSVSWQILQKSSPVVPIPIAYILFHVSQRSSSSLYYGFYTFHPSFSWSSNWSFCIRLPLQIHLLFSLFIHSQCMIIPS